MSWFEEDVVGFYISVKNVVLVKWSQSIDELSKNRKGLFFGEGTSISQKIFQGATLAELIDQVDIVGTFDHFNKFDNINILFKSPQSLYLIFHELWQFRYGFEFIEFDHFYGNLDAGIDVEGTIYFTVLAFAEVACHSVVVYYFYHWGVNCFFDYNY